MPVQIAQIDVGMATVAAGTGIEVYDRFMLPGKWYITDAYLVPGVDVAQDAANVTTIALVKGSAIGSMTTLDSHNTTTGQDGALTKGVPVQFTPAEGANRVITQGDLIGITKTDGGTGKAISCRLCLLLERRDLP